ncbi:MAG TPA: nitrogen fixation protein NifZ [Betaproteobacteria bacterium]|nr:nitrogen fixation protein NifZ [Betaproteobacteria bacterium]
MFDVREPKYQWGQPVCCTEDLLNDGSHPEHAAEALLAARGSVGEIINVGCHMDSNTPVYLVEFTRGLVVGCLEEELTPVDARVGGT